MINKMTKERKEAYVEVLEILNFMEEKYVEKLPIKLIEFFKRNKSTEYSFILNTNIPLKKQKLKEETLNILAMLYLNYWYKDNKEKQALLVKFQNNDTKFQEELNEKYSIEKLFKKRYKKE